MIEVIEYTARQVGKKHLARLLFPNNAHSLAALNRLISGKSEVTLPMLLVLKKILGVSLDKLILDGNWVTEYDNNLWSFENSNYFCVINNVTFKLVIYRKNDKKYFLFESVLLKQSITLKEVFSILNKYTYEH